MNILDLIEYFERNNVNFTINTNPSKKKIKEIKEKIKHRKRITNSYIQLYKQKRQ